MIKLVPDSHAREESVYLASPYGPPAAWRWDRPLRLAGALVWEHPTFWGSLLAFQLLLAGSGLPLLLWVPVVHALACGATREQLLDGRLTRPASWLRWGRSLPGFLALHGVVLLGATGLRHLLPEASFPAALALGLALLGAAWVGLACSHSLSQGHSLGEALPRALELVRRRNLSALRLTACQLGLLAFPAGVFLGTPVAGLWALPGGAALIWVWIGWMLWGIQEEAQSPVAPLLLVEWDEEGPPDHASIH